MSDVRDDDARPTTPAEPIEAVTQTGTPQDATPDEAASAASAAPESSVADGAADAVPADTTAVPSGGADSEEDEEDDDDENTLEGEAEIAADYLEELLDIADLDGDIDTYIEGERAHVSVVTESQVLVGEQGEVLDALQELTRLAVMTETGDRSRLMLDVAGFRDKRRQELLSLAEQAVQQATSTQQSVPLEPMNPFERKIVHDAVAAAGLTSESEGDEPKRHVVVQPKA